MCWFEVRYDVNSRARFKKLQEDFSHTSESRPPKEPAFINKSLRINKGFILFEARFGVVIMRMPNTGTVTKRLYVFAFATV